MSAAIYHPFTEDDSIRLLLIDPNSRGSPISCRSQEVRLSSKPDYFALSYTWGAPVSTHTIQVNGHSVPVRQNLYTALQYLRDENEPQVFWIDALCINQEDVPERNQQVQIMGQIYKGAAETVV
jgi:hypothetical protein